MIAALVFALQISTASPEARAAFDRGMVLYDAYNGDAAYDAFASALQDDPHLAIAAWGQALAAGPDLNTPLTPERTARARDAIRRAKTLEQYASVRERAYIDAMNARYDGSDGYGAAMAKLAASYPTDDDAQMLYAEALMERQIGSAAARAVITAVLARDPRNVMANHLCIHSYDYAADRRPGLACADRLVAMQLDPQEAHLAHMPAHAYIDNGLYDRAIAAARRAWALREASNDPERYRAHDAYTAWSAAMMLGDAQSALLWAQRTGDAYGGSDRWITLARFGQFDDIRGPSPPQEFFAVLALGLADLHRNDVNGAKTVLARYGNADADFRWLLEGAIAQAQHRFSDAVWAYSRAAEFQARVDVGEQIPLFPAGEFIGSAYLANGDYRSAVDAYTSTLARYPNDPRALFGLAQAQKGLGKAVDAAHTLKTFAAVWDAATPPDVGAL